MTKKKEVSAGRSLAVLFLSFVPMMSVFVVLVVNVFYCLGLIGKGDFERGGKFILPLIIVFCIVTWITPTKIERPLMKKWGGMERWLGK